MYGSFGSYSSMSLGGSGPINIYTSVTSRDESCAFPSWPRRSSLSGRSADASYEPPASSYLSDDDLFLDDDRSSGSEAEDSRSVSSSAGSASPPTLGLVLASPARQLAPSEAEILETQRRRLNMRKDLLRMVQQEKERRRQQQKSRRPAVPSKKSTSGKARSSLMAPITEADE
ncbi:hypothetical protein ISF_08572 [Cordyceps fumosorosea ARSEF 2679]|uniref:Uncharacterized protein n=1 Tax=Cordyceps fumosorosea (strain ARSEF 2679) TaxID=1081104 RepID=A0A162MBL6_CORFA|nr:hypothetical protein ISF_08572 [Cordyceps fumosorosea ARSEF 2679]OAA53870.1 hypothetical protein ISF_08572 [Cordyceps fumosorosea ARSEF 2679]